MTTAEATQEVLNTPESILLGAKAKFSETMANCPLFRRIADIRMANRYGAGLLAASVCSYEPYVSRYHGRTFVGVEVSMDDYLGGNRHHRIRFAETVEGRLAGVQALANDVARVAGDGSSEVVGRNMALLVGTWNSGYGILCDELGGDSDTINTHFCLGKDGVFEVRKPAEQDNVSV